MPGRRHNPVRMMWASLALFLFGATLLVTDAVGRGDATESIFIPRGPLGYVGISLAGAAILWWLIVLLTCRCPSCGAWIHPWHYPRPDHHCPKCGKTGK